MCLTTDGGAVAECFRPTLLVPRIAHHIPQITTLPHSLLLYATHLTRVHIAAGRTLVALRPVSCFTLNSRPAAALYGECHLYYCYYYYEYYYYTSTVIAITSTVIALR